MSEEKPFGNDKLTLSDDETGEEVVVPADTFFTLDNKEHANRVAREYAQQALKDQIAYRKQK